MRSRNLPSGKGRPENKADNFTVICEPIVLKMWEPRSLTTLRTSKACYFFLSSIYREYGRPDRRGVTLNYEAFIDFCRERGMRIMN
jgi:hypothetical protein